MALVPEGTISLLRTLKEEGYSDTAQRLVYTVVAGGYSYGRASYPAGDSFACRFTPKPSPDLLPGADVEMTDADLFFAQDVVLLPNDRVRITHIHGDAVTQEDYKIVAGPVMNSLGQRATLKLAKE
jgi:hypothetical protein